VEPFHRTRETAFQRGTTRKPFWLPDGLALVIFRAHDLRRFSNLTMAGQPKVFGIGYSKTGTTSLTYALRQLGYSALHFAFHALNHGNEEKLELRYDKLWRSAYTDTPIPVFFRELDERFPGSKFILTMREMSAWLRSCELNHIWPGEYVHDKAIRNQRYVRSLLNLHYQLYGSVTFNRRSFQRSHERHIEAVREYFKDRPEDLLILDVCGGSGWKPLCQFLDKPVPRGAFPRVNVGVDKFLKRQVRRRFWRMVAALHFGVQVPMKYEPRFQ